MTTIICKTIRSTTQRIEKGKPRFVAKKPLAVSNRCGRESRCKQRDEKAEALKAEREKSHSLRNKLASIEADLAKIASINERDKKAVLSQTSRLRLMET